MRMVAAIVGLLILAASPALWSQEPETNVQALESLAPEIAADFDERIALVMAKRKDAQRIESQLAGAEGLQEQIIGARLDVALGDWFRTTIDLADQVVQAVRQRQGCCQVP